MLDLETLDNRPTAVIRSIGAVRFSRGGGLGEEFYVRVDPQSCLDAGLTLGIETVQWWMKQGEAARLEMCKPGLPLGEALDRFCTWVGNDPVDGLWGNGAAFDNAILSNAYAAIRRAQPWKFWSDRCYRTIKAAAPSVAMPRAGTHHNALDDAKSQAQHLLNIWAAQGGAR